MSIEIAIPDVETLTLAHLVLDMNGTLARDGILLSGVPKMLARLQAQLTIHLITANTHGGGEEAARALNILYHAMQPGPGGPQKLALVQKLGPKSVVAVGNGANDAAMLQAAGLGIAVMGGEGVAVSALMAADIVTRDIIDALALLLYPDRIRATLRR
jgi:P-type E1-E2 ATPase